MTVLRCVTCRNTYEAEADIHSRLKEFDDHCICWNCVRVYRKTPAADAASSGHRHEPASRK
jgi:hypothetical protein